MDTPTPGAVPAADDMSAPAVQAPVDPMTAVPAASVPAEDEIVAPATMSPTPAEDLTPATPLADEPMVTDPAMTPPVASPIVGGMAEPQGPASVEELPNADATYGGPTPPPAGPTTPAE